MRLASRDLIRKRGVISPVPRTLPTIASGPATGGARHKTKAVKRVLKA